MRTLARTDKQSITWGVLAVLAMLFVFASPRFAHVDFVAFYCAGSAVASDADPYREMPLNACERNVTRGGIYATGATVPAPLPPYALAPLAVVSRLPFDVAYAVFTALSLLALAIAATLLRRSSGIAYSGIVAILASTAVDNLRKGQPQPLMCLSLVAAAWALTRGRDSLAAIAAAFTMIEPHIGLPVCCSLFLWRPRSRVLLLSCAAAAAFITVLQFPGSLATAYVTQVLPLHARSEASWITQLSLSSGLMLFAVPPAAALAVGFAQYALTAAFGVAIAARCEKTFGVEMIVLAPPIFAVLGGTYVHQNAMLLALPGAIVIAARSRRMWPYLAVGLVAISWLSISEPVQFVLSVASGVTIASIAGARLPARALAGISVAAVGLLYAHSAGAVLNAPPRVPLDPNAFAERSWADLIASINPAYHAQVVAFIAKLFTWIGLLVVACLAFSPLESTRRQAVVRRFGVTTPAIVSRSNVQP